MTSRAPRRRWRWRFISIAALAASILSVAVPAPAALAAGPVDFTITESNFVFGDPSADADFVATGPLCPAGRLHDTYVVLAYAPAEDRVNAVLTETTFTCADGSGTFKMQKEARLIAVPPGVNNTGPVTILGGTGAYARATGNGMDVGSNGVGHISSTVMLH